MSDTSVESPSWSTNEGFAPWHKTVTTISVFALLALGIVAACTHGDEPEKPKVEDLIESSSTVSKAKMGRLRIGVWDNIPYISYRDPTTNEYQGFDIEIARAMAKELGFREDMIEWVNLTNLPRRLSVLRADKADLVVASFSMTSDRLADVAFAGPYLVVPQAVLVPQHRKQDLDTISDLKAPGVKVCTTTGSTSEAVLQDRGITTDLQDANHKCMEGLRAGVYDAFSTDEHILAAFDRDDEDRHDEDKFEVLDTAIAKSDEKIGIAVPKDDASLRTLVTHFLYCWKLEEANGDSPWLRAYNNSLSSLIPDMPQPDADKPSYSGVDTDEPPYLADADCQASPARNKAP